MTVLKERLSTLKGKIHLVIWVLYWTVTALMFFMNSSAVIGEAKDRPFWVWILYGGFCAFLVFSIVYCIRDWLFREYPRNEKGKKIPGRFTPKNLIVFAFIAIFAFFVMELMNNTKLLEMRFLYALLNIVGAYIMILIMMAWLNSSRRASVMFLIFALSMSVTFYCVYLFRGEPFQFIDIFALGTAMEVAGGYTFVFSRWAAVMIPAALCMIGIVLHSGDYKWAFSVKTKILSRIGVVVFMVLAFQFYINVGWNTAVGITADLWAPHKTYEEVGTNMGFCIIAKFMRNDPPSGYSISEVERVEEEFEAKHTDGSEDVIEVGTTQKPVNIIAIMNEAWTDYSVFDKFATNESYMPFFYSMNKDVIKGHTLVCISGGGTAKTEYEFLTGNSVKQYPGMVPYVSYYTHDQYSMVTTLEAQGYETIAMHPNKGTNWNRDMAYDYLGFDKFVTIDDFDPNCEKFRGMISDKANYEKIIEEVENKEDPSQPLFLFDITMQNHGGYGSDNYPVSIETEGYTDDGWNRYLSLVRESDDALKYLIEYFENCDEPTMIVMFGDHFPSTDNGVEKFLTGDTRDDLEINEQEKYYATPFFIWANYDIPEEENVVTSTNFLGTLMLKEANAQLTPFNNYQLDMMGEIQAYNHKGYTTDGVSFTKWSDAPEEIKQKLLEYEYLQYNALVEDGKRTDSFFMIQEDSK